MEAEQWGALPLGELHPRDRCARCGAKANWGYRDAGRVDVRLRTNVVTKAHALYCVDVIACERRHYKQKALF